MSDYWYGCPSGYEDNSELTIRKMLHEHPIEQIPIGEYYISYKYDAATETLEPYWEKHRTPNGQLEYANEKDNLSQ